MTKQLSLFLFVIVSSVFAVEFECKRTSATNLKNMPLMLIISKAGDQLIYTSLSSKESVDEYKKHGLAGAANRSWEDPLGLDIHCAPLKTTYYCMTQEQFSFYKMHSAFTVDSPSGKISASAKKFELIFFPASEKADKLRRGYSAIDAIERRSVEKIMVDKKAGVTLSCTRP